MTRPWIWLHVQTLDATWLAIPYQTTQVVRSWCLLPYIKLFKSLIWTNQSFTQVIRNRIIVFSRTELRVNALPIIIILKIRPRFTLRFRVILALKVILGRWIFIESTNLFRQKLLWFHFGDMLHLACLIIWINSISCCIFSNGRHEYLAWFSDLICLSKDF